MKFLKFLGKTLLWLLILAILVCPIYLIFRLSAQELAQYETPPPPVILDSAYGDICPAYRGDLHEFVTLNGEFVCHDYAYMELDYKDPSLIRWEVSPGELITPEQVLGWYKDEPVISSVTGMISSMQTYGQDAYIQVRCIAPTVLECRVEDSVLRALRRGETLTTGDGMGVSLLYTAPMKNPDGSTTIRLSVEGEEGAYGQQMEELTVYTGRVYTGVLMVDSRCVYQRQHGEGEPWYVRQVSVDGIVLQEVEVQVGYNDGKYVCVTGVNEGEFFDAGYKSVLAGGAQ